MKPKQQPVIALIASMMLLALPAWADGEADGGDLPNVTSTPCTAQPDGYEWTDKKSGRTFVCQNGVSVLKGLNPPKRPCVVDVTPNGFSDEHCRGAVTNEDGKTGTGGKGNDKTGSGGDGKGGNGTGKGSGGGTGGGSGSGGGSAGSGSGSGNGGAGAGSGSGGSGSAGSGSGNGVQGSGAASPDRGSGGGSGGGAGATSGNDTGGSSGSGSGSGSELSNEAYLAALRDWGKRWADYFKSLAEREQAVQTNLTRKLADCVMLYGATQRGKECSDAVIKKAELEKQRIEKLRSDGIARAAKEKAAIDAMKPRPAPNVPMPNGSPNGGGNGGNGGNGDNITNNNNTTINNNTNTNTTINNNTNVTNNGGSGGSGKSGSNGNDGKGNDANDGKGDKGNPNGKPDGEEKGETLSEYCKNNSNALSCVKLGDQEDIEKSLQGGKGKDKGRPFGMGEHEIGIPQINRSHDFVESGVCPAPKQVMILGAMQEFSYQPMCDMAIKIRPAVILSAILLAFFIVQTAISRA